MPEFHPDWMIRLAAAVILGGVVGFNREKDGQPAGLRTHIILVVGACLAMLVSIELGGQRFDPARLASAVLSGIGFLGAGAILRYGPTVRGLTTAATLWTMAVIGLATGAGYLLEAGAFTFVLLVVLGGLRRLEARFLRPSYPHLITIIADERPGLEDEIRTIFKDQAREVDSVESERLMTKGRLKMEAILKLKSGITPAMVCETVSKLENVRMVRCE